MNLTQESILTSQGDLFQPGGIYFMATCKPDGSDVKFFPVRMLGVTSEHLVSVVNPENNKIYCITSDMLFGKLRHVDVALIVEEE